MKVVRVCLLWLVMAVSFLSGSVLAGDLREIELKDGSVLTAEVLSLHNGVYTLHSSTLGTITVAASKIRAIRLSVPPSAASPTPPNAHISSLQQTLLGNPEIMTMILSLQSNPAMQAILADPAVMRAVSAGDLNALLAHPKFLELLNDPTVRDIVKQVEKRK
jgi:hypothetical protein